MTRLWQRQHRDKLINSGRHEIEERRGVETDPEHENQQWSDSENLAPVEVFEFVMMRDLARRTKEHFLEHIKNINCRHNHAKT